MKIVAENNDQEIAKRRAMAEVRWALIDLAANILRVTRGGGKSYELGTQAQRFIDGLDAYYKVVDTYPDSVLLDEALSFDLDHEFMQRISDESRREMYARHKMLRGALQVVASRLLAQRTQEAAGRGEFYDGFNELEDIRAARQREYRAAMRQGRPRKLRRKRKPKKA